MEDGLIFSTWKVPMKVNYKMGCHMAQESIILKEVILKEIFMKENGLRDKCKGMEFINIIVDSKKEIYMKVNGLRIKSKNK